MEARRSPTTLAGKVAVVTGRSRGIGAAIARLFAAHGAKVAVHGRDRARLSAVRDRIEDAGGARVLTAAAALQRPRAISRRLRG